MTLRSLVNASWNRIHWRGSSAYWEQRYAAGGNSGAGSYGAKAQHKADIVNAMVADQGIRTVVELGCGDGNQLKYAAYPKYLGLDVSATAITQCIEMFADDDTKSFLLYDDSRFVDRGVWLRADAALSLEVIFHLVEDMVFEEYMRRLFAIAERQVIICSSNREDLPRAPQERHRRFTGWVAEHQPDWELVEHYDAGAGLVSEFFRYSRASGRLNGESASRRV